MPTVSGAEQDKTQTMSTAVTETNQKVSQFVLSNGALTLPHPQGLQETLVMQAERYENIDDHGDFSGDQVRETEIYRISV